MPPTFHAVLIGNREFPNEPALPTLRCPLNDVRDMAELLKTEQHGPYQVTVLEDEAHHVIHRSIYSALKNAGREDRVLIYYAGHGKLSDDDGSLYLASHNTQVDYLPATSVAAADVMKFMNSSASKQLILILDCCYSGAVDKLLSGAVFRGEVADGIASNLRGAGGRGSYVLTASTSLQRAEEREGDTNGLLTKHLIAGIRDGRADRDDDGLISMHELTQYVQDQVRSEGRQTPLAYTLREEDGGIIIARTGKAARSRKLTELLDEIYAAAVARRASLRTVRSALTLLVPEPTATAEDKALSNQFVDQLHSARLDSHRFIEVLEDAPALASRLASLSINVQRRLDEERKEAQQQLRAALDAQQNLRDRHTELSERYEYIKDLVAVSDKVASEFAALKQTRDEEQLVHQSTQAKLQGDLAAQKELLAAERRRTKEQEAEIHSLQNLIAEANAAIEKLTHQANQERSKNAALKDAAEAASIQAEIAQAAPEQQRQRDAIAEKSRQPGGPFHVAEELEEDRAILTNLDTVRNVLAVLRKFTSAPALYIHPDIPSDKLANASAKCKVVSSDILALLDNTVFGSAKDCLLFGDDRIYWHDVTHSGMLRYAEIDPASIRTNGASTLYVNGHLLHVSTGSKDSSAVVATILKALVVPPR